MESSFYISRLRRDQRGFTLIELTLASVVSFVILAATVATYLPTVSALGAVSASNDSRLQVASTLETLQSDASNQLAIYVDPAQCYQVCMTDGVGNRTYYWWDPAAATNTKNLYRKQEPITNAISCTGGSVVAVGLDSSQSTFAMNKSMLNVTLAGYSSSTKSNYLATTGIFPSAQETTTLFYEGFECASLRQGWIVNAGAGSVWSITAGSHFGDYQIGDSDGGGGMTTTTLQAPVNLARVATAQLQFYYMNTGTLSPGDSFTASFYDGANWNTLFTDTSSSAIPSFKVVNASLVGYAFNANNQIQFSGTLQNAGAHWYLDQISVFQP